MYGNTSINYILRQVVLKKTEVPLIDCYSEDIHVELIKLKRSFGEMKTKIKHLIK